MFGRVRASSSSLETLEGSPSKILKDDSFSIYEATLMKLKLGAQREANARASSMETDEVINDCSVSSVCTEDSNAKADFTPSTSELVVNSHSDEITMMDTDCSSISISPSFSENVSTGNLEQRKHSNVSILHFFKFKDPGGSGASSCGETTTSTKNGSSGSVSSASVESRSGSEVESIQILQDCELYE